MDDGRVFTTAEFNMAPITKSRFFIGKDSSLGGLLSTRYTWWIFWECWQCIDKCRGSLSLKHRISWISMRIVGEQAWPERATSATIDGTSGAVGWSIAASAEVWNPMIARDMFGLWIWRVWKSDGGWSNDTSSKQSIKVKQHYVRPLKNALKSS